MNVSKKLLLFLLTLIFFFPLRTAGAQEPTPTPETLVLPMPAEIINAVNSLRLSHGLTPLTAHPILMQIAQEEANGIASGLPGHWRPNDITLGQWLISLGYPLSGDLTLDGYRSENFVSARTAKEAIDAWLGDDLHRNTMLSTERSDIGAGVATIGDEIFVVIETAWQTKSGKMSSDAYPILTQMAYDKGTRQAGGNGNNGDISQYSMPVELNTALPNGEVYHEVQYGQSLWSVAIKYNTTIKQIQQFNNLSDTTITIGQKLLVIRGATLPAPSPLAAGTSPTISPPILASSIPRMSPTSTPQPMFNYSKQDKQENMFGVGAIAFAAILLGGVFATMTKRKSL